MVKMPLLKRRQREKFRSGFKTPSEAQWLRCPADSNAHVLSCTLRFKSEGRLALEPDLRF